MGRGKLSGKPGLASLAGTPSGYQYTYGVHLRGVLKPFTTDVNVSGVPHYEVNLAQAYNLVTGRFGASSSGLNPYGTYTLYDGIVWSSGNSGHTIPADLEGTINPDRVRSLALKNPQTVVGVGYDIFGYPAPNYNERWNASGVIYPNHWNHNGSGHFLGINKTAVSKLSEVPQSFWKAGPLDLRWHNERKVWTAPQSVYAGIIRATYVDGDRFNEVTGYYFSEQVQYDAEIYDGYANQYRITNVLPRTKRPVASSYKITPLGSGDSCLIIHSPNPSSTIGRPMYAIYAFEPPAAEECEEDAPLNFFNAGGGGPTWDESDDIITGAQFASGLILSPLKIYQGGTGLSSIPSGTVLLVNGSGLFVSTEVVAGSGINISQSANLSSGIITIALSTGTAFVAAGINTNITELQGLTTPLTVEQGGTGATGVTYCTLDGEPQAIDGIKTFSSGIILGSNSTINNLRLRFAEDTNTGFAYPSGYGFSFVYDSARKMTFSSGLVLNCPLKIDNQNSEDNPPLQVYGSFGVTDIFQDVARFYSSYDELSTWINHSGVLHTRQMVIASGNEQPLLYIKAPSGLGHAPFAVTINDTLKAELSATCEKLSLGMSGSGTGGYLLCESDGKSGQPGYVDITPGVSGDAGYLKMEGGAVNDAGFINTSDGGGSIHTKDGYLQLGTTTSRSVISKSPATGVGNYSLPQNTGTIAVFSGPSGYSGTLQLALLSPSGTYNLNFSYGVLVSVVATGIGA